MSYYFMHEDGKGFLKICAGKMSEAGEWEFYAEVAELPPEANDAAAESMSAQFFSVFMATKAQLFWQGKIEPNSDDYGHPVLHG